MTAPLELQGKEEEKRRKSFRDWSGCVTTPRRNALPDGAWYYLENLQPIGSANAVTVRDISALLHDYASDTIYWAQPLNLGGTDYIISFASNGKVFAYNIGAATSAQINAGPTLLSGSGSRMDQWKNQILLIIDSTGYYYWDGTTFAKISGSGAPSAGSDIAVVFGRVWIVNGRAIFFSGVNGFSNGTPSIPDGTNYWDVANGAGNLTLTDPVLRNTVTRMRGLDGYLYYMGDSSIWVISDVYVPDGATPPTPVFSNLNIQANLGTDQPGSVFSTNRELTFANKTGIWAVQGVQAARLSADIDGTWKYVDFSQPIWAGVVNVNNILTRAILMKRLNDPIFGSNTVLCMYWDNKWWFANFGAVTILVPVTITGVQVLYGYVGNKLYQLFSRTDQAPPFAFQTALWPMEDPIQDKQVIRAGIEVQFTTLTAPLALSADSVNGNTPMPSVSTVGFVSWINNNGNIVSWKNNSSDIVNWFTGQFLLFDSSAPGMYSKYVGMSGSGQGQLTLGGVYMDYKLGAAW